MSSTSPSMRSYYGDDEDGTYPSVFIKSLTNNPFVSETYRATLARRLQRNGINMDGSGSALTTTALFPPSSLSSSRNSAVGVSPQPKQQSSPPPSENPLHSLRSYIDPVVEESLKPNPHVLPGGPLSEGAMSDFIRDMVSLHLQQLLHHEEQERNQIQQEAATDGNGSSSGGGFGDSSYLSLVQAGMDVAERVEEAAGRCGLVREEARRREHYWGQFQGEVMTKVQRWARWRTHVIIEDHWRAAMCAWMEEASMRAELVSRMVLVEEWWGESILNTESDLHAQLVGGRRLIEGHERRRRLEEVDRLLALNRLATEQNGQLQLAYANGSPTHSSSSPLRNVPLHPLHRVELLSERSYLIGTSNSAHNNNQPHEQRQPALLHDRVDSTGDGGDEESGNGSPLRDMLWYYTHGNQGMLEEGRADRTHDASFYPETMVAQVEREEERCANRREQAMIALWKEHEWSKVYQRFLTTCTASRRRVLWEEDAAMEAILRRHNEEWVSLRQYLLVSGTEIRRKSASASPFQSWERQSVGGVGSSVSRSGSPKALDLVQGMFAGFARRGQETSSSLAL